MIKTGVHSLVYFGINRPRNPPKTYIFWEGGEGYLSLLVSGHRSLPQPRHHSLTSENMLE